MAQPAASRDRDLSFVLTEREIRGIRFNERYPWVPLTALAAIWILFLATTLYKFSVLVSHGEPFGLGTWSELWDFAKSWRDSPGPYHRYHLLVLETLDEAAFQASLAFLLSVFAYAASLQNGMIRRLRDALRESG